MKESINGHTEDCSPGYPGGEDHPEEVPLVEAIIHLKVVMQDHPMVVAKVPTGPPYGGDRGPPAPLDPRDVVAHLNTLVHQDLMENQDEIWVILTLP